MHIRILYFSAFILLSSFAPQGVAFAEDLPAAKDLLNLELLRHENEVGGKLASSCEKNWVSQLAESNKDLLFDVMEVASIVEKSNLLKAHGLGKLVCPSTKGEVEGAAALFASSDEAGRFYCERPNEVGLQKLPATPECAIAAEAIRHTGLGSQRLNIKPNSKKQLKIITSILSSRNVSPEGMGKFFKEVAKEIAKDLAAEKAKELAEAVQKELEKVRKEQEERNREADVKKAEEDHQKAEERRKEAEKIYEEIKQANERQDEPNDIERHMESTAKYGVESAREWENKTQEVVEKVKSGICTSIWDCADASGDNSCQSPECIERSISKNFMEARNRIKLCEARTNQITSRSGIEEFEEKPQLSERVFSECRIALVENSCLAAGSDQVCEGSFEKSNPLDFETKLREIIIRRITENGSDPCGKSDLNCRIAVKLETEQDLTDIERAYAQGVCGHKPVYQLPKFEKNPFDGSIADGCTIIGTRTACGEEASCLRFVWSNPGITPSNYKMNMMSRFQCLNYGSVEEIIRGRRNFVARPKTYDWIEIQEKEKWAKKIEEQRPAIFDDIIAPKQEIKVSQAGALNPVGFSGDPLISLILGIQKDQSAFKTYVCERL